MVMATATVPTASDIYASDWLDGVVTPPEGHVHGKAALTQQEWRRLHRRSGGFVMVVADDRGRLAGSPKPLAKAAGDFRHAIENAGAGAYGPHGSYRLSVMAADDWQHIKEETG
jgi:hypothetical protein